MKTVFQNKYVTLFLGDVLEVMRTLPDKSVDCVITSPPYWQLRDYGYPEQWGLEKDFNEYLEKLFSWMDEVWRVLKDEGTVWVNLGDSYYNNTRPGGGAPKSRKMNLGGPDRLPYQPVQKKVKKKTLMLIPQRFAIGCIDRGWILRNEIIIAKRNGMPESVKDRLTIKHEYMFFFAKQKKYYYQLDGIREPYVDIKDTLRKIGQKPNEDKRHSEKPNGLSRWEKSGEKVESAIKKGKNPGDVSSLWEVVSEPKYVEHYATFNTAVIRYPILAGCPKEGIILDPFCGTGTVGKIALETGRNFIGIDGSGQYLKITERNIRGRTLIREML